RQATTTKKVAVDNAPPAAVNITLGYHDAQGNHPLAIGQTVYAASPTLLVNWTASNDGNGLGNYLVGWTGSPALATNGLKQVASGQPRTSSFQPAEAHSYYAEVISQDVAGNQTTQTVGPIYVDSPQTPDLVGMDYHGWLDSGGTQLAGDQAVSLN